MRRGVLLDTCALIWAISGELDRAGTEAINAAEMRFVSSIAIWEIEIKGSLGRLRVPPDPGSASDVAGFDRLAFDFDHASEAGRLPGHHSDPFDRALIAQARVEGLVLATADAAIGAYDVPILAVARA